jgi:hypothetical protein
MDEKYLIPGNSKRVCEKIRGRIFSHRVELQSFPDNANRRTRTDNSRETNTERIFIIPDIHTYDARSNV